MNEIAQLSPWPLVDTHEGHSAPFLYSCTSQALLLTSLHLQEPPRQQLSSFIVSGETQTQVSYTYVFTSSCQVANWEGKESFFKNKSKWLLFFLQPSSSCHVLISGLLQDSGTKGTIYKHYCETQRASEQNKVLLLQENWRDLLPNIATAWKNVFFSFPHITITTTTL